jgi:hypothetical protein
MLPATSPSTVTVLGPAGRVTDHPYPPVRQEAVPIASGKLRSPHGLLLTLVFEEHLEVRLLDIAQLHLDHGASMPGPTDSTRRAETRRPRS